MRERLNVTAQEKLTWDRRLLQDQSDLIEQKDVTERGGVAGQKRSENGCNVAS